MTDWIPAYADDCSYLGAVRLLWVQSVVPLPGLCRAAPAEWYASSPYMLSPSAAWLLHALRLQLFDGVQQRDRVQRQIHQP